MYEHVVKVQAGHRGLIWTAGPTKSSWSRIGQQADAGSLVVQPLTLRLQDQVQQGLWLPLLAAPTLHQQHRCYKWLTGVWVKDLSSNTLNVTASEHHDVTICPLRSFQNHQNSLLHVEFSLWSAVSHQCLSNTTDQKSLHHTENRVWGSLCQPIASDCL